MSTKLGEKDYRLGGLERLRESGILLGHDAFAGATYVAGRAVESMLRALIWKNDADIRSGKKSLDTGHDLRQMLGRVADLGVLRDQDRRDELATNIQRVARLWFNNMRFVHNDKLKSHWFGLRELGGKRTLKQAAYDYYDACSSIVKRCEALCQS